MDIVIEILLEIYGELMMLIVPERKASSKVYRALTIVVALTVIACVAALVIWGLGLIIDRNNKLGYIPIAIAAVISAVQIAAGIVLYGRRK